MKEPAKWVAVWAPEMASSIIGGECASIFFLSGCAANPVATSSLNRGSVTQDSADWPRDLMDEINTIWDP